MAVRRGQWQRKGKKRSTHVRCGWIWRKMQRVSWMEKKTNESVCTDIGIEEARYWNRRRNATTNSAKKEARILWTCYAIRWIGKRNDAGTQRWKEEERVK